MTFLMAFLGWYTLSVLVLGQLLSIATIGKPRKPIDPGTATFSLIMSAPIIAYVVFTLFR